MPRTLILDSEAVSALADKRRGMAERLAAALQGDHRVLIPSVVLAELATGGPRDAALWHLLARLPTVELNATVAMRAGGLREQAEARRRKKRDLTVDAVVAATAVDLAPSVILTGDPKDLRLLVGDADVTVSAIETAG